jgi:hypothetical protein
MGYCLSPVTTRIDLTAAAPQADQRLPNRLASSRRRSDRPVRRHTARPGAAIPAHQTLRTQTEKPRQRAALEGAALLLNGAGLFPPPPEPKPGEGGAQQSQVVGSGTPGGGGREDVSAIGGKPGNNSPGIARARSSARKRVDRRIEPVSIIGQHRSRAGDPRPGGR